MIPEINLNTQEFLEVFYGYEDEDKDDYISHIIVSVGISLKDMYVKFMYFSVRDHDNCFLYYTHELTEEDVDTALQMSGVQRTDHEEIAFHAYGFTDKPHEFDDGKGICYGLDSVMFWVYDFVHQNIAGNIPLLEKD